MPNPHSQAEYKAAAAIVAAVAEAIREAKEIPSGHLYAVLCGKMSLESYQSIIRVLVNAGLVHECKDYMLRWIGGKAHA